MKFHANFLILVSSLQIRYSSYRHKYFTNYKNHSENGHFFLKLNFRKRAHEFISKLYLWVIAFTFALQREYFEIENSHNKMKKIQNFIFYNFDSHFLRKWNFLKSNFSKLLKWFVWVELTSLIWVYELKIDVWSILE